MQIAGRYVNASLISCSYQISKEHLAVYRIIYCLFIALLRGLPSFSWMSDDYNYVFNPPKLSIAKFFDGFPPQPVFIVLSLVNVFAFVLMGIGYFTKFSSLVFACTYLVGSSFAYSFGKIDHDLLFILTPIILGIAGWGERYSVDNYCSETSRSNKPESAADSDRIAFYVSIFALMICFAFFTSGVVKVYGGWWKWNVEAVKFHVSLKYYFSSADRLGSLLKIDSHVFWKFLDYSTLIFEILFLFAAISRKIFTYFIAVAVVFHCLVFAMLTISFASNLIVYVLFIDWKKFKPISFDTPPPTRKIFKILGILLSIFLGMSIYWVTRLFLNTDIAWHPSVLRMVTDIVSPRDISLDILYAMAFLLLPYVVYVHLSKARKAS